MSTWINAIDHLIKGNATLTDYVQVVMIAVGLFMGIWVMYTQNTKPDSARSPSSIVSNTTTLNAHGGILSPSTFTSFPLQSKTALSANTTLYRFSIPHIPVPGKKAPILGLPIGQHISITAELGEGEGKKVVQRSYTPTTLDGEVEGGFDLVVKTYEKGNISRYLSLLTIGQEIKVKGPRGKFIYSNTLSPHLLMIAGGTGITPMYQIIKASLGDSEDKTVLRLVYANVAEEDILLRKEMDELVQQSNGRFAVYHVLNKPPPSWSQGTGFVSQQIIEDHMPSKEQGGKDLKGSKVLMCGPKPMTDAMSKHLQAIGYPAPNTISKLEDQVFCF